MPRKVESLEGFLRAVEKIPVQWDAVSTTTHPWFRGQQVASWDLKPGLYRGSINCKYEREILRDFKLRSPQYLETRPQNDLEWLFVMQHYGMPTRLLDWTESYLYALYFAVVNYQGRGDACVWVLDPWALNEEAIGMASVPISEQDELRPYYLRPDNHGFARVIDARIPVAIRPSRATPRIEAQKGAFTIHGSIKQGLNLQAAKLDALSDRLIKIPIAGAKRKSILMALHRAGVTATKVFPDLEGLCEEVHFRYSQAYMKPSLRLKKKRRPRKRGRIRLTGSASGRPRKVP